MAQSGKLSIEVAVKSSSAKFFNLFTKQLHDVQNHCERVHEAKLHQGDWHNIGTDSVKHWTYVIDGKVTTCKENIESIDEQSKTVKFNLFDGDISQYYKVFKIILQVEDKIGGGSTVKWTIEYEKISEDVEAPYGYMEYFEKCTTEIDAYLLRA